jgi:hypothetical protein
MGFKNYGLFLPPGGIWPGAFGRQERRAGFAPGIPVTAAGAITCGFSLPTRNFNARTGAVFPIYNTGN